MTSHRSPDEGLQNHRVSNEMFSIGMTAVHTVCVAGSSVLTLITRFSDSFCILDTQEDIYLRLLVLHFLYCSSIFDECLDTLTQAMMLLLGDKQRTVWNLTQIF